MTWLTNPPRCPNCQKITGLVTRLGETDCCMYCITEVMKTYPDDATFKMVITGINDGEDKDDMAN